MTEDDRNKSALIADNKFIKRNFFKRGTEQVKITPKNPFFNTDSLTLGMLLAKLASKIEKK